MIIGFTLKWVTILLPVFVFTACAETRYVEYNETEEEIPFSPVRTVMVEIDREFYEEFPDCVVVMPPIAVEGLESFSDLVEDALFLHLARKISRVVGGVERDLAARKMAVDLSHPDDREAFLEALDCDALVTAEIVGPGKSYFVVWSQVRIGLDVRMTRVRDRHLLWRARHIAERSEGGIPFTPFGVVIDGYSSAQFTADREIAVSVVDDAVRRIVASLPDAITFKK